MSNVNVDVNDAGKPVTDPELKAEAAPKSTPETPGNGEHATPVSNEEIVVPADGENATQKINVKISTIHHRIAKTTDEPSQVDGASEATMHHEQEAALFAQTKTDYPTTDSITPLPLTTESIGPDSNAAEHRIPDLDIVETAVNKQNAAGPEEDSEVAESQAALSEIAVSDETGPIAADMLNAIPQATESPAKETSVATEPNSTQVYDAKPDSFEPRSAKPELSEPRGDTPDVKILGPTPTGSGLNQPGTAGAGTSEGKAIEPDPSTQTDPCGPTTTKGKAAEPDTTASKKKRKWPKSKKKKNAQSKAPQTPQAPPAPAVPGTVHILPGQTVVLGNFSFLISKDEYNVAVSTSGQELFLPRLTFKILNDGMVVEYVPEMITNEFCQGLSGMAVPLERYVKGNEGMEIAVDGEEIGEGKGGAGVNGGETKT
ncbi:MAG: Activating transcription factor 7-interacting protein 1 [Icmadophila ericetorum]|nr:Activating transcription factor 7-interacting protein 1 [Icmadophila ericetorum]